MNEQPQNRIKILLLGDSSEHCHELVSKIAQNSDFSHCELIPVSSFDKIIAYLSNIFDGVILFHTDENEIKNINSLVELRNNYNPTIPVIVLLSGQAEGINIKDVLKADVNDVVVCSNKLWLEAVLAKYFFRRINRSNINIQTDYNSYLSHVNRIHYEFPFGLVRVVINPNIYVEYINKEAQRILGFNLTQHQEDPDLINRFLPKERIKLVLENAGTGHEFLRKRIKISSGNENIKWVEAVYIPGYEYNKNHNSIEVILRDITDEEVDKVLQKSVYDIARMTSSNFSLNRVFTIINKIIEDLINIDNIYIALYDEDTQVVSFPYFVDIKDAIPPKPRKNSRGLTEYILRTGKSLICQPDCFDKLIAENEIEIFGTKPKSWLGVPLKYHDKIIGVLAVQHYSNPNAFGEREKYILEFFSEQIARTVDYKRKSESIKLLSAAVEQSPVSIIITSLKPEIVYVNSTFTDITGYESKEVIGRNPRFLQSGLTPKERFVELWDTITTGNTWRGEFINKRKNGEIFYEESIIVPITDELGRNSYYLSIKIDVTEKKKLIQDLITAKEKAEESDKLKTAFLQNISHEIRTPMNAIVGFAEILENDHDNEEKISYYTSVIKQRSYDLLDIVNELLDISRIESGQLKAEFKPFELNGIFTDLLQTFEGYKVRMERHDIEIKLSPLPENISNVIVSDEAKLRQVFTNLIHNAMKFTHKGYIEFGFHELNNDNLVFRVSDTGIGIPADMQDKIFERFQKSSPQGVIYDGLGLGLTIVQSLVNLLGGKIWLKSEVGKGTTFYFSIPYKPETQNRSTTNEEVANPECLQRYKLLIVEDDTFNVAYFKELFDSLGFEYHIESSGLEAIEHFRSNPSYDMVLMDIKLPDMTGYDVIEKFKSINPEIPIIAQTAYAAKADREKALKAGCVDYISKPIFRDKLLALLHKHLVHN
ncbi:ATP-binding protein [Tenuifilum thalassicum]|uniref:histidine kinase n=1 Tax=Tenuifilum thalassicum TaxID=2590900 RepID=A0A7D4CGM0_9BACT|nr:ATP-binding protein [Tenuifilum thalassicum]QKG79946.1 response regulator [Tenuifilum thalassicum]